MIFADYDPITMVVSSPNQAMCRNSFAPHVAKSSTMLKTLITAGDLFLPMTAGHTLLLVKAMYSRKQFSLFLLFDNRTFHCALAPVQINGDARQCSPPYLPRIACNVVIAFEGSQKRSLILIMFSAFFSCIPTNSVRNLPATKSFEAALCGISNR